MLIKHGYGQRQPRLAIGQPFWQRVTLTASELIHQFTKLGSCSQALENGSQVVNSVSMTFYFFLQERYFNFMARQGNENQRTLTQTGWPQFNIQKIRMVSEFRLFQEMSENRPTQTDKGRYAETLFRAWLEQFLPQKYGVTSGYIITQGDATTPRKELKGNLRHYDVIIYNRLESPVLWTEMGSDRSPSERVRAIPVEYVHAVLEIKSTFNEKHITDAFKKLNELTPLLGIDDANAPYKRFLPPHLYLGVIFFELPKREQGKIQLLNTLLPSTFPRGLFGGIILSADGLDLENTGHFWYHVDNSPYHFAQVEGRTLLSKEGYFWSDSIERAPNTHQVCMFGWTQQAFAMFAFDLINIMNGTYDPNVTSSWHGLTFSI